MPAPPPKPSRRRLALGLAVAGVALAGGVVAVVVSRTSGPTRSRDGVIKETIAALAAGDENKLFELADPVTVFETISRCDKRRESEGGGRDDDDDSSEYGRKLEREQADERDPAKLEKRWRAGVKAVLRRTTGTKLEVVDILTELPPAIGERPARSAQRDEDADDDDAKTPGRRDRRPGLDLDRYRDDEDRPEYDREYKLTTYHKGTPLMAGCYAKVAFRRQQVKIVVDIKDGERELTQRVKVSLQEIDGAWYLAFPPSLDVGFAVVLHDLQDLRDKTCACSDAGCIEDLDAEQGRPGYAGADFDRDANFPRDLRPKLEQIQRERRACEATARGGPELARYKDLGEQACACTDEECGRKLELQMMELRRTIEANVRRQRSSSYEVTRQLSDLARAASACTRKLAQQKVRVYSLSPTSGALAGGTFATIRGANFTNAPRTAKVFFGTKEATSVRFVTDREILVEVPPGDAEGYVDVRVIFDPGGAAALPYGYAGYTYRRPHGTKPTLRRPPTRSQLADDDPSSNGS